jgi:hypothetical protein
MVQISAVDAKKNLKNDFTMRTPYYLALSMAL